MSVSIRALTDSIAPHLKQVETLFEQELKSDLACVNQLVRHVSRFRGKMLRPMLVLLSGQAAGELRPEHVVLATVVEMVHMATLVHDDVLDDAELRRKGATINHLRGNEAAVLLGDYLISHSYHLCSSIGSQATSRAIAHTTNEVCEGELLQIDNRGNYDLTEQTYLNIITRKTASLCGACCMLGASLAGATEAQAAEMECYGRRIGEAFQIQDDILDLNGDVRSVGKTLGTDIEKGKMTLPMIHFMRTAPLRHRDLLHSLLTGDEPDKAEKIRNLILPSGSLDYATARAARLVDEALAALKCLPESEARTALELAARFVIDRPM
jgi:octaprenyl-diphosphate synthase